MTTNTANVGLIQQAHNENVNNWDPPVTSNFAALDLMLGGITVQSLSGIGSPLALSPTQCQNRVIMLTGTIGAIGQITFVSSIKKRFTISSTGLTAGFTNQLQLGVVGFPGAFVGVPPGQTFDIFNDGTNISFHNFGPPIGGYWDHAGSSVPRWVTDCSVPPYLNCLGGTFSAVTYPVLAALLGGNVLPDFGGRVRAYLNQGQSRLQSSLSGIDGNTNYAAGGVQTVTLSSLHLPKLVDVQHTHAMMGDVPGSNVIAGVGANSAASIGAGVSQSFTGLTYGSSSQTFFSVAQPTAIGGLTLIRAA